MSAVVVVRVVVADDDDNPLHIDGNGECLRIFGFFLFL